MRSMDTDYLVIGAGAMGMAFADAVIDHSHVHVTLVDRRHGTGGHWRDAYPIVPLHQADLLRTVERVVRLGRVRQVTLGELVLEHGVVRIPSDSVVVHCAASGLQNPPMVPIWGADAIRLQTIRAGFPCFCAALAGYVEVTRDDDGERNRLCPPNIYGDTLAQWALMQARGLRASATYGAESDIAAWANACALNPGRTNDAQRADPLVKAELARVTKHVGPGVERLFDLAQAAVRAHRV